MSDEERKDPVTSDAPGEKPEVKEEATSESAAPSEPAAPSESAAPSEPVAPEESAAPSEPAAPSESAAPSEPAAPEESAAPSEPSEEEKAAAEAAAKEEAAAKAKAAAEAKAAAAAKKAAIEAAKPPWERDAATPEWLEADDDPLVQALRSSFGEAIHSAKTFAGELTLEIGREQLADVAASLKSDHGFTYLADLCGVDYPDREERFEVVYHAYHLGEHRRIRFKTSTDGEAEVPSVVGVWRVANWFEREAYDMYGVRFAGHPDMTRILLWEGFEGYPMRKDFPIEGVDTGAAIYPEYYESDAGPVAGTGTGWKPPEPPEPPVEESDESADAAEGEGDSA